MSTKNYDGMGGLRRRAPLPATKKMPKLKTTLGPGTPNRTMPASTRAMQPGKRTKKNRSILKMLGSSAKKALKYDKDLIKSYAKHSYLPALKMTGEAGAKGLGYAWKGIDKVGKKLFGTKKRGVTENAMRAYHKGRKKMPKKTY
ncbi:hypothetical protein KAR91_81150 [Candidatus Pacearchaeota archaeon]|nr:hypothetical protein [Candidatus Pacearchaeota archaeon]